MQRLFKTSSPFEVSPGWKVISYVILGIWTFIALFPFYWLLVTAFKLPIDVNDGPKFLPFVDFQPSTQAWNDLVGVKAGDFVSRPYFNTIIVGLVSSVLALIIGAGASYALTRFNYRPKPGLIATFAGCAILCALAIILGVPWFLAVIGAVAVFILLAQTVGRRFKGTMGNNDIAFWLVSQRMLPPVVTAIPVYVMFQQIDNTIKQVTNDPHAFGILTTPIAMIIAYIGANLPLVVWFMRDYFQSIPIELEECAFIDGATRFQVLFKIILPLSVPGLVATFLIVLVFAWNEYVVALFLSTGDTQTMPLLVAAQNATRGPQWWNISILVLLMVAPIVIMALILERFIVQGLLVGAVKG